MSDDRSPFRHEWRRSADGHVAPLFEILPRRVPAADAERLAALCEAMVRAESEAQTLLSRAKVERDEVIEEARREGRIEGHAEVIEELAQVRAEAVALAERAESDLVELAFRVAGRIIGRAIELEPSIVVEIVARALGHARGRQQIILKVNPEDLARVEAELPRLERQVNGVPVALEGDAEVSPGGALIETEAGRIDARLEEQLDAMRRAILGGR